MSKRLLVSLIIIAMSVAVIGAGTFAYYRDSELSENNTFTAGSLDLQVHDGTDWVNGAVVASINHEFGSLVSNLKPGDSGVITIPVMNSGSLPGTPSLKLFNLVQAAGLNIEPEGDSTADLGGKIDVVVKFDGEEAGHGTLSDLADATLAPPTKKLPALGVVKNWTIEMSIGTGVGNEIMDDSATCDVLFGLDQ